MRALQADLVHAFVLRATSQICDAVELYRQLAVRLADRFGPEGRATLAGQADLAVALHAAGCCAEAVKVLHRAYAVHREAFGAEDPQGIQMLTKLGVMNLDCGEFERAHQYFDLAKGLCAQPLAPHDPLVRQVIAAARASGDTVHTCGQPARSQPGLDVRDLFMSSVDLDVRDVVGSAPDLDAPHPLATAPRM